MSSIAWNRRSSSLQRDRVLLRSNHHNSLQWWHSAQLQNTSPRSSFVRWPSTLASCHNEDYATLYPQRTGRKLSLNSLERLELQPKSSCQDELLLARGPRSRSLPFPGSTLLHRPSIKHHRDEPRINSRTSYRHGSSRIFDGSFEEEAARARWKNSSSWWKQSPHPKETRHQLSVSEDVRLDQRKPRPSLRERFAVQVRDSGLSSIAKPWLEKEGEPGSSAHTPGTPIGFHFHLPSFSASRAAAPPSSPLVSPRGTPSGQQKGFFDYVSIEKSRCSEQTPLTLLEALQSTPNLPPQARHQDQFRVSVFGEELQSNEEFVGQLPDHLPSSPLCPKNPKHKSGGRGRCPVHGRNRISEDSLSEENEPVIWRRKNLQLYL